MGICTRSEKGRGVSEVVVKERVEEEEEEERKKIIIIIKMPEKFIRSSAYLAASAPSQVQKFRP